MHLTSVILSLAIVEDVNLRYARQIDVQRFCIQKSLRIK